MIGQTIRQLEKEVIELRQQLQRQEHRERVWIELEHSYKTALWKYSVGKKPDQANLQIIQDRKNQLGIGNGVLRDEPRDQG